MMECRLQLARIVEEAPWPVRHEPGSLVFRETLHLMGGFGDRLYNDMWTARASA